MLLTTAPWSLLTHRDTCHFQLEDFLEAHNGASKLHLLHVFTASWHFLSNFSQVKVYFFRQNKITFKKYQMHDLAWYLMMNAIFKLMEESCQIWLNKAQRKEENLSYEQMTDDIHYNLLNIYWALLSGSLLEIEGRIQKWRKKILSL